MAQDVVAQHVLGGSGPPAADHRESDALHRWLGGVQCGRDGRRDDADRLVLRLVAGSLPIHLDGFLARRAPGGRPMDPGALRIQGGAGDLFLLRTAEQTVVQHGLPQRASRLPPCGVVTPPGGARRGPGVLQPSLPPPLVDQAAFPRTLQPQVRAAQPHRAADARAHEGRGRSLTPCARPNPRPYLLQLPLRRLPCP